VVRPLECRAVTVAGTKAMWVGVWMATGCYSGPDPAGDRAAVAAVLETQVAAWNRGDLDAFAAGTQYRIELSIADDLASYRVIEREPVATSFLGRAVAATPSPSRGGAVVTRALAVLDHGGGSERIDRLVRALHAGYEGHDPAVARPTGTTHISVVDAEGNAAALSSTLGSGSGVFRAGFQLNNMLGELDVIGEEAREPRERLPSMMTPTLVLEDGRPRLVLGSAGSVRLAGAIAQVLANVIELEMPVEQAIAAPRVHVEGGRVHLEGGHDERAAQHLAAEGWEVVSWSGRNLYFGGVSAVEVRADGALAAAGDPRRGGHGVVVG